MSNFTINSAGISPSTQQSQQRARSLHGRRNIQPQQMTFDIKCDSPGKLGLTTEDVSFYSSHSPQSSPGPCPISPSSCMDDDCGLLTPETSPSKFTIIQPDANVQFIGHNTNSMDSGYSTSLSSNELSATTNTITTTSTNSFQFVVPRQMCEPSPHKNADSSRKIKIFHSLSSGSIGSMDDELELMELENIDEDTQMPADLSSLISKTIKTTKTTPENKRSSFAKRCLDMNNLSGCSNSLVKAKNNLFDSHNAINTTPKSSSLNKYLISTPERQCLQSISENHLTPFAQRNQNGSFKRPEPPAMSPIQSKRYKSENDPPSAESGVVVRRPLFRKSMSMNDANIMNALSRSNSDPTLIGDFSKPFCLPIIEGKHTDLKSISADTMAALLRGEFSDSVASFKVIDCRYPYEYDGGHIQDAVNYYTQEQVMEHLVNNPASLSHANEDGNKRHILVFHCEFSSERGPKL